MTHRFISFAASCFVLFTLSVGRSYAAVDDGESNEAALARASVRHADALGRLDDVPVVEAPPVDVVAATAEDEAAARAGLAPRFAIPNTVFLTPDHDGVWEAIGADDLVWRLRVTSAGATSLNLGFTRYHMPRGGRLLLYSADDTEAIRPFTASDNAEHGELWTPIVRSDDLIVEVTLPRSARGDLVLELTSINVGYRGFGSGAIGGGPGSTRSGACNVDVVCPQGDPWRDEIGSVGVISTGGSLFCSGAMVNNTAQDATPYFLTARHCGIDSGSAASLVVYWNYETSTCGGTPDGVLSDFQTGSFFRASYATSDFTLVLMDSDPDPSWGVTFAGWSRSSADATSATAIHHPSVDEKRISFEYSATTTTSYLGTSVPGNGSHVRVIDWDLGTTEGGSSGSPLFDSNHRVIGQLHGGYAACGNDLSDWYGRFSVSWNGGGSSSTRLRDWLDSGNTGQTTVDTYVPNQEPTGACCNADTSSPAWWCQEVTQAACDSGADAFFGGSCGSAPCATRCAAECDWCWTGTVRENNCPVSWDGDGECDCGCQFADVDCLGCANAPYMIGGAVYDNCADPLGSGVAGVPVSVSCDGGYSGTVWTVGAQGLWTLAGVPCGTCTVSASGTCYVGSACPPAACNDSVVIAVNDANQGSNQSLGFLQSCTPYDMNGDGFVSIIGDVPCFVSCLYFNACDASCFACPCSEVTCACDCNGDGFCSLIGDVPCFVDCAYFGNCAASKAATGGVASTDGFTVGGAVFEDEVDPLSSGVSGIRVEVQDEKGHVVGSTETSGAAGLWQIDGLAEGRYVVNLSEASVEREHVIDSMTIVVAAAAEAANQSLTVRYEGKKATRTDVGRPAAGR